MSKKRLVICCCSDYHRLSADLVKRAHARFAADGYVIELIPDLCQLAVADPARLQEFSGKNVKVLACRMRTLQALFALADVSPPPLVALLEEPESSLASSLSVHVSKTIELPDYGQTWKAWYPLIDQQRCNRCGKCIDYCLFGVYETLGSKVCAANPTNCKTNCPACARVCPQQAIIFPKFDGGAPIDGGKQTSENKLPEPSGCATRPDELFEVLARRRAAAKKSRLLKEKP